MTLQNLKQFEALVNYQSFTLAAEILHISQSALSHSISTLEKELGTSLFERQGAKTYLTEHGTQLLHYVRQIFAEQDNLHLQLNDLSDPYLNPLCIAVHMGFYPQRALLRQFQEENPKTHLIIYQHDMGNMAYFPWDLIFSARPDPNPPEESLFLFREPLCLLIHKNHPLQEKKEITPKDLTYYPGIRLNHSPRFSSKIEETFQHAHETPYYAAATDHFHLLIKQVETANYWAIIFGISQFPEGNPNFCLRKLSGLDTWRYVYLSRNPKRYCSKLSQQFQDFTFSYFQSLRKKDLYEF